MDFCIRDDDTNFFTTPEDLDHAYGEISPIVPNVLWGTDATATWMQQQCQVTGFAVLDHFTGECLGIHAAKYSSCHEAPVPIRQSSACLACMTRM